MSWKKEYNVWRHCHIETDALGFWRITWPDGTYADDEKYSTRQKAENDLKYYCSDDDE